MLYSVPGKLIALIVAAALLPVAAILYLGDHVPETRAPKSPAEIQAVEIARAYARIKPYFPEEVNRPARIANVRGQWEVHFPPPPPWGATGTGGPIITVDKVSGRVVHTRATD